MIINTHGILLSKLDSHLCIIIGFHFNLAFSESRKNSVFFPFFLSISKTSLSDLEFLTAVFHGVLLPFLFLAVHFFGVIVFLREQVLIECISNDNQRGWGGRYGPSNNFVYQFLVHCILTLILHTSCIIAPCKFKKVFFKDTQSIFLRNADEEIHILLKMQCGLLAKKI